MKDERKKSEQEVAKLEQAMKDERKKSEQEAEEIRRTNAKLAAETRRLELELEGVRETVNDAAHWISIGVCLFAPFLSSFLYSPYFPSVPTTVRSSAESSSAIFLTVFKPGSPTTSISPTNLILAAHRHSGGESFPPKEHRLVSELTLPIPSFKMFWLLPPNPSPTSLNYGN